MMKATSCTVLSGSSAVRKSSLLVLSSCRLTRLASVSTLLAQQPSSLKPQTVYSHLHSFRNYQSLPESPGSLDPESSTYPSGDGWGGGADGRYFKRENESGFPWSKGSWEGSSSGGRQQQAGGPPRAGGNGSSQQWEPRRREDGWGGSWPNGGKQQWGNGGGGSSPRYQQFGNRGGTTPVVPKVQNVFVSSYAIFGGSTMMMVSPSPALFMSENLGPPSFSNKYRCLVDGTVSFVFMRRKENDRRRFDKDSRVVFRAKPADLAVFLSPLPYFPVVGSEGNGKGGGKRRKTDQTDASSTTPVEIGRVDNREDRNSIRLYLSADDQVYSSAAARVTISISFPRTTATPQSRTAATMEQRDTPEDSAMGGADDRSGDANRPGDARLEAEHREHGVVVAGGVPDSNNKSENDETVTTWDVKTTVGEMRALQMLLQSVLPSLYGWQILANPSIVNSFLTTSGKYSGRPSTEQPIGGSYNSGGGTGI
eukprot:GHVS01005134.1.p1 GENE.GHVS01005134.1~~GHVS01005134.1.p1  ORF type:complete len:481 (+),score=63.55 GHVS01005134.1:217-1659(+)